MTDGADDGAARLNHVLHLFRYHSRMLRDEPRNQAFLEALRRRITPGCAVIDIGSGTGIWAIAAAQMGAERVVAVERNEYLVPMIKNLARANGVEEIVEVVHGNSHEFEPSAKFDLVVSETIGNQGFDEQIIPLMLDARQRLLKEAGAVIPEGIALFAAPARLEEASEKTPEAVPLDYSYFESMNSNVPVLVRDRSEVEFIADPSELLRVDLSRIEIGPDLGNLTARWNIEDTAGLTGFASWAEATLAEEIKVSTLDATSWDLIHYPLERFQAGSGEVELTLSLAGPAHFWTATLLDGAGGKEVQSFSPVFAQASLESQLQELRT